MSDQPNAITVTDSSLHDPAGGSGGRKGRPSKRNPELENAVVMAVASGVPVKLAARQAGVDPVTFWRWRKQDETLDAAIGTARAAFIARQVHRVDKAAEKDARHAQWLLERLCPEEFGRRQQVDLRAGPMPVIDPITGQVVGGDDASDD